MSNWVPIRVAVFENCTSMYDERLLGKAQIMYSNGSTPFACTLKNDKLIVLPEYDIIKTLSIKEAKILYPELFL